jgi:hypothetical protein
VRLYVEVTLLILYIGHAGIHLKIARLSMAIGIQPVVLAIKAIQILQYAYLSLIQ